MAHHPAEVGDQHPELALAGLERLLADAERLEAVIVGLVVVLAVGPGRQRAIFVPGEPVAAAAQILLARFDIVLGAARKALRSRVTRGSLAGSGFRDSRQQLL